MRARRALDSPFARQVKDRYNPVTLLCKALLTVLVGIASGELLSAQSSPRDLAIRFCELDSQGAQMTPDGWKHLSSLFSKGEQRKLDQIMVIRDFAVSQPLGADGKIGFLIDYTPIGWIDAVQASFSRLPESLDVRGNLVAIKEHEWRLEGPVPPPHLGVAAAIRYITTVRQTTGDQTVRKNADRTRAILRRFGTK